jgi:aspartate aminotransferase-like enzyme
VQDTAVAETMAEEFGVHVGVGVSRERGRMIRIGSMGEVTAWKTKRTLRALCEALSRHGVKLPPSDSIIENIVDESFSSRGF